MKYHARFHYMQRERTDSVFDMLISNLIFLMFTFVEYKRDVSTFQKEIIHHVYVIKSIQFPEVLDLCIQSYQQVQDFETPVLGAPSTLVTNFW